MKGLQAIRQPAKGLINRNIFWKLYILTIPFQRILYFPGIGSKIQLPELAFIPWLFSSLKDFRRICNGNLWTRLDLVVLLWPAVMLLPGLRNGITSAILLEIAVTAYLVIIYFLIRISVRGEFLPDVIRIIIWSAVVTAGLGLLGWFLEIAFGLTNPWVIVRKYPYFGTVGQAMAYTMTPNMQASIIMVGMMLQTSEILSGLKDRNQSAWIMLAVLVCGFFVTLSKTIVPLAAGMLLIILLHRKSSQSSRYPGIIKRVTIAGIVILALVYLFGSHYYLTVNNPRKLEIGRAHV